MSAAGQCEWHLRWPIGAGLSATRAAGKMAEAAAASVYEQLKELRCPLLDGVFLPEPGAALGLLCAPSAQRLELLAWLCARANPPLQEQFATLTESQMEEKTQEMAKLGSDLLLCRSDELDLIEGEASAERQLRFMEQLLDVIRYLDAITGTDTGDSTTSSREESLRGAARKNEEFLREVFSSPSLPALLAPTLPPCTADIKPLLLEELAPHMRSRLSGRSSGKTLAELSRTLEEANAALERLSAESSSLQGDTEPLAPGTALQTLALAACDSHQLMAAFRQVYETELREHCVRGPAPRLSPCGPLAQHLHQALTLCTQELRALAQLSDTSEQVVQTVERRRGEQGTSPPVTLRKLPQSRQRTQASGRGLGAAAELM
ncbi:HAUS augmin-like complex subunit 7 isoform X1 [Gopherus flavomarginatus]|uniref:HAUS augmin-like complex subunit 7 isoform X1 n=1 Tax=Gopherus flavomarginatus TaxID=286002 RepID=UPI0021CBF14A|nr:HAUS augmin-like complex subunit 7 isoform X1 [Gopherus flavomarginatus]